MAHFYGTLKGARGKATRCGTRSSGEDARRTSSLVGRKCRAEYVEVRAIYRPDGTEARDGWSGLHQEEHRAHYVVDQITKADGWDDDIRVECAPGIHFFISRKEAEEYTP